MKKSSKPNSNKVAGWRRIKQIAEKAMDNGNFTVNEVNKDLERFREMKSIRPTEAFLDENEIEEFERYAASTNKSDSVGMNQMREMMMEFIEQREKVSGQLADRNIKERRKMLMEKCLIEANKKVDERIDDIWIEAENNLRQLEGK